MEFRLFSLFFTPCPDPDPNSMSEKGISGKEVWPLDLDDLAEVPPDEPFDFLRRECLGTAGKSCDGESWPWLEFRCCLMCRVVCVESRLGESADVSLERWCLVCFASSNLRRGELTGDKPLPVDLIFRSSDSWIAAPVSFLSINLTTINNTTFSVTFTICVRWMI